MRNASEECDSAPFCSFVVRLCGDAYEYARVCCGGSGSVFPKKIHECQSLSNQTQERRVQRWHAHIRRGGGEQPVTDVLMVFSLVRFIRNQTRVAYVEQWEADARQLLQTEGDHELFMQTERWAFASSPFPISSLVQEKKRVQAHF